MLDSLSIRKQFPALETELLNEILAIADQLEIPADTPILNEGDYVHAVPLVLRGMIRVSRKEQDKELLLYYIRPGEMCIMSFSACCSNSGSMIVAGTAEPTEVLLLPSESVRKWLIRFPTLSTYAFSHYHSRYLDLIGTINEVLFNRLDERLMKYLNEKTNLLGTNSLSITHQQIANDLGTAREVVSRLMKKLEKEGMIEQERNLVRVRNQ